MQRIAPLRRAWTVAREAHAVAAPASTLLLATLLTLMVGLLARAALADHAATAGETTPSPVAARF